MTLGQIKQQSQSLTFKPVPSVAEIFRLTPEKKFIFLVGPVGSTKTTTICFWLLTRAASQEPSPDGIRRSRFAITRNTLTSIKQTVLRDIRSLFGPIAEWRPSENTIRIQV